MFSLEREDSLMEVIHKKTGDRYYVDDIVVDSTNDLEVDEQVKVLYRNEKAERFVREAHEFFEKFDIPSGFNVLSKACELALNDVKAFHNRVHSDEYVVDSCSCSRDGCSCNKEKEYIGEMIDVDVYQTYKQTAETHWYVPLSIVKPLAYTQLCDLFTIRCSDFEIVKKEYDNATDEYFLVGYKNSDYPHKPSQVCKLPKKVFERIYDTIEAEEEDE